MFRNYLKLALRNLLKNKVFSLINISGLAIGIAACLLIVLFITDEFSFDKQHVKRDRIYRLEGRYERGAKEMVPSASANFALAPLLKSVFPEIENYTRLIIERGYIKYNGKQFPEDRICYTDSSLFSIFSFQFVKGNPLTALNAPNTAVVTESFAGKYFKKENPLGRFIDVNNKQVSVTGIIKEMPSTSHFHADVIISVSTVAADYPLPTRDPATCNTSHYTYLLLPEHYDYQRLQAQFPAFIKNHIGKDHNNYMQLELQPLNKIHLYSHSADQLEAGGDISYIYIFGAVALVILLIACINYINLTTARSIDRAKEIGLRKVTGASKTQLIKQFLGESILIALPAMFLAYLIAFVSMPLFNQLSGKALSINPSANLPLFLCMGGCVLATCLLSGIYPAFFMASFNILRVLKGNGSYTGKSPLSLRKNLVVVQFSVSIVLIISTLLIYSQLQFIRNKKLGFVTDQLITVPLTEKTSAQFTALKNGLLQNRNILAVTSANNDLTTGGLNWRQYQWKNNTRNDVSIPTMDVDPDFFTTLGTQFVSGRGFSKDHPADVADSYVINETAAKFLNLREPVNERLTGSVFNLKDWNIKKGRIIGVVKDFHFSSLRNEIKPVVFNLQSAQTDPAYYMWLRISSTDIPASLDFLKNTWKTIEPEYAIAYSFIDEDLAGMYRAEENFLHIVMIFAGLAIFIACLGIFGLAFYTAVQRVKEIGIRKTLGASVSSIVILLSKEFTRLVLIAFVISIPIAWYMMSQWLQNYAYRIAIGPWVFILSGGLTFLIAWLAISYQSVKAALTNPVKSIRTE